MAHFRSFLTEYRNNRILKITTMLLNNKIHICSAFKHYVPWDERHSVEEWSPSGWPVGMSVFSVLIALVEGSSPLWVCHLWADAPESLKSTLKSRGKQASECLCGSLLLIPALCCCHDFLADRLSCKI